VIKPFVKPFHNKPFINRPLPAHYVDNKLPAPMVFYCKDCEKIVEVTVIGRKFVYKCNICKTKNVAFGTEKSIKNFFHIKDPNAKLRILTEEEKKLINADKL
jgi:hypothetical protein